MLVIRIAVMSLIAGLGYYFGRPVELSDQWGYFEALRTTSSIVFGVLGALLAIVYPEVIKQGFRADVGNSIGANTSLHRIVDPLAQSAILLVILVILAPFFAWLKTTFEDSSHIQGSLFGLLCMLSAWQVWILLRVLQPLDLLRTNTDAAHAKAEARRRIHRNP